MCLPSRQELQSLTVTQLTTSRKLHTTLIQTHKPSRQNKYMVISKDAPDSVLKYILFTGHTKHSLYTHTHLNNKRDAKSPNRDDNPVYELSKINRDEKGGG